MQHGPHFVIAALGVALLAGAAARAQTPPPADTYSTECGDCHVAFPGKLLPRPQWGQVLGSLDRHYGVDASLDATTLAAVARQLGVSAPAPASSIPAKLPRITTQPWFREEHDELPRGAFQSKGVQGAADCSACHPRADRGDFDEHAVRLPR